MADEKFYEGQAIPDSERVGFCQDCGRPLNAATVRTVGSGVFCEPCLERRVGAGPANVPGAGANAAYGAGPIGADASAAGWQNTGSAYPPPPPVPPVPPAPGTPHYTGVPTPWLAGLLGFIPGVGAMYNGQFAKGVVHLIVFAVLVSLSDHVSGVFGLFVAGWIFFMAFEAFHTARARLMGLPLPDPFGWNNIGERLGFGKNWPGSFTGGPVPPTPGNATWHQPPSPPPAQPGTDWVGYVPPTNFAGTPGAYVPPVPVAPVVPVTDAPGAYASAASTVPPVVGAYQAPVTPGYGATAIPYTEVGAAPVVLPPDVPVARKFPVGAIWLIGLGLLFLVGNINHSLHLSWRWLTPLLIGGFAIYLLVSRLRTAQAADTLGRPYENRMLIFRGPVMLMTVAVLMTLQTFDVLTFGQTWPALLVVLGALLFLERSVARRSATGPMPVMDSDVNASPSSWDSSKGGR